MSSVKAAVLRAYNQPLELREFPDPTELGPGEALVRVEMAGICGTDVHLKKGQLPIPLPVILGHEAVGYIERLGPGLEKDWRGQRLAEGDRVTWASSVVCGECYYCRVKQLPTRCVARKAYGISYCADEPPHLRGAYAQKIHLRAGTAIFRIPDEIPAQAVAGAGCGLVTAIHGLSVCPVEWQDVVIVQGTGPVGLAAIAVARNSGASYILAIGGPKHRLELARKFGADATIDINEVKTPQERREAALKHVGPYGADLVIECAGLPEAVNEGIELCRDGGRYLVLGQYANAGNIDFNPHLITRKELKLYGSWGFEPRHVDKALKFLEDPLMQELFSSEITHRFKLEDASQALETVEQWKSGKAVLLPNA